MPEYPDTPMYPVGDDEGLTIRQKAALHCAAGLLYGRDLQSLEREAKPARLAAYAVAVADEVLAQTEVEEGGE